MYHYQYDYASCATIFNQSGDKGRDMQLKCMKELLARNAIMPEAEKTRWKAILTASLKDHTAPVEHHRLCALILQKWVYRDPQGIQVEINDLYDAIMSSPGVDLSDRLNIFTYEFSSDQFNAITSQLFNAIATYRQGEYNPLTNGIRFDKLMSTYKNMIAIGKRLDESQKAQFVEQYYRELNNNGSLLYCDLPTVENRRQFNIKSLLEDALLVFELPVMGPSGVSAKALKLFDEMILLSTNSIVDLFEPGWLDKVGYLKQLIVQSDVHTVNSMTDMSLALIKNENPGQAILGADVLTMLFVRLDDARKKEVAHHLARQVEVSRLRSITFLIQLGRAITIYADKLTEEDADWVIEKFYRISKQGNNYNAFMTSLSNIIEIAEAAKFNDVQMTHIIDWMSAHLEDISGDTFAHEDWQVKAIEGLGRLGFRYTSEQAMYVMDKLLEVSHSIDENADEGIDPAYTGGDLNEYLYQTYFTQFHRNDNENLDENPGENDIPTIHDYAYEDLYGHPPGNANENVDENPVENLPAGDVPYNPALYAACVLYASSSATFSDEQMNALWELLEKALKYLNTMPDSYCDALQKMMMRGYKPSTILEPLIEKRMSCLGEQEDFDREFKMLLTFVAYMRPADRTIYVEKMMAYLCQPVNISAYPDFSGSRARERRARSERVYRIWVAALEHINPNDAAQVLSKLPALHNKDYAWLVKLQLQAKISQAAEPAASSSSKNDVK